FPFKRVDSSVGTNASTRAARSAGSSVASTAVDPRTPGDDGQRHEIASSCSLHQRPDQITERKRSSQDETLQVLLADGGGIRIPFSCRSSDSNRSASRADSRLLLSRRCAASLPGWSRGSHHIERA